MATASPILTASGFFNALEARRTLAKPMATTRAVAAATPGRRRGEMRTERK